MKNKLLNSFFILSMMLAMSSFAYASEITGNLSSGGNVSSDTITGSLEGTVVSDGGSSGGGSSSGSRPRGTVLGASTSNIETDYSNAGALYPTRTIVAVTPTPIIIEVPTEEVAVAPTDVFTNPVNEAATDASGWTFMDWFFMAFLFLLFVLLVMYVINQSKSKERLQ